MDHCEEAEELQNTIPNFIIITSIPPSSTTPKTEYPCGLQRSLSTIATEYPKSNLHIFHTHNARQWKWSGEVDHTQYHYHCLHHPPHQRLQNRKTLAEDIIHKCKCIRYHLKSHLHTFNSHNTWQWSGELVIVSLELRSKVRSGPDLGSRRCYFCEFEAPTLSTSSTPISSPSPLL